MMLFLFYILIILLCFIMGLYVFYKHPKSKMHLYFFIITVSVNLWIVSLLYIITFESNPSQDQLSDFFARLPFSWMILFIGAFVLFSYYFPRNLHLNALGETVILCVTIILFLVSLSDFIVVGMGSINGSIFPELGKGFFIFLFFLFESVILTCIECIRKYKALQSVQLTQLKHFTLALFIFIIGATFTNIILAIFLDYIELYKSGPFFALIFVSLLLYSIARHRFLANHIIIKKKLFFLVAIIFLILIGIILFLVLQKFITLWAAIIFSCIFSSVILLTFKRIKYFFDGLFFFEEIDFSRNFSDEARKLNSEHKTRTYIIELVAKIQKDFSVDVLFVFVPERQHNRLYSYYPHHSRESISFHSAAYQAIQNGLPDTKYILKTSNQSKAIDRLFKKQNASLMIIAEYNQEIRALICVSAKKDGSDFSQEEIKKLQKITATIDSDFHSLIYWYETIEGMKRKLHNDAFENN